MLHRPFSLSTWLLAVPMVALMAAGSAHASKLAASGTVRISACTVVAPGVALGLANPGTLPAGDSHLQPVRLALRNCGGISKATITVEGTPAPGDDTHWENTASDRAATGVSLVLLHGSSGDRLVRHGDDIVMAVTGSSADYDLRAGYHRRADTPVSAGRVGAEITLTAAYE